MNFFQENEATIRLSVFIGVFTLMALLEVFAPRKERVMPRMQRWVTNWSLVVIDSIAVRLLIPTVAVAFAQLASSKGWGVFGWLDWPVWLEIVLAVILLDMLIYWQHVASHHFPLLWRMHKVHHADRDIDVTTGARFHPLEILLSMAYKLLCILLLGPATVAVFLFEVILNASAMFNHSNVRLPLVLDRWVRRFIVTPDMHRVHHSVLVNETNSNYGFFLSVWDRVFNSYIDQPERGHDDMRIGLGEHQDSRPASLWWSLKAPFFNDSNSPNANEKDVKVN